MEVALPILIALFSFNLISSIVLIVISSMQFASIRDGVEKTVIFEKSLEEIRNKMDSRIDGLISSKKTFDENRLQSLKQILSPRANDGS